MCLSINDGVVKEQKKIMNINNSLEEVLEVKLSNSNYG